MKKSFLSLCLLVALSLVALVAVEPAFAGFADDIAVTTAVTETKTDMTTAGGLILTVVLVSFAFSRVKRMFGG